MATPLKKRINGSEDTEMTNNDIESAEQVSSTNAEAEADAPEEIKFNINEEFAGKSKSDAVKIMLDYDAINGPPKPTVLVKTLYDHHCTIGGVTYNFKAGVAQQVPENVRCILSRAGKLRG